jgi:hypothetical protein
MVLFLLGAGKVSHAQQVAVVAAVADQGPSTALMETLSVAQHQGIGVLGPERSPWLPVDRAEVDTQKLASMAEQAYQAWIGEELEEARSLGQEVIDTLDSQPAVLIRAPALRRQLYGALMIVALAQNRLDPDIRNDAMVRLARQFSSESLDRAQWGPEAESLLNRWKDEIKGSGRLRVQAQPDSAEIFVDERPLGAGKVQELLPVGEHRIAIRHDGHLSHFARVNVVDGKESFLQIDASLHRALVVADSGVALRYPSRESRDRSLEAHVVALRKELRVERVYVFAQDGTQIVGLVAFDGGTRSAAVDSDREDAGTILVGLLSGSGNGVAASQSGRRSLWPGLAGIIISAGLIGGGSALIALDGEGTCDEGECENVYQTRTLGWVLVGTGAVALGLGSYLLLRSRRVGDGLAAWPVPGGVAMGFGGRF